MKSERILNALGQISDTMIADAQIGVSKKKSAPQWVRWAAVAACLCLLAAAGYWIAPLLGGDDGSPLVITVYAQSADGAVVETPLQVGEKVKMYPQTSALWEGFEGYALNLTLFEAKYVFSSAVDENWKTLRYPGDSSLYNFAEDVNWATTEGNAIWWVHVDQNGEVIPPGEDTLMSPKLKGSEILWRPNSKGHNRAIIGAYNEDYELLAVYYLEITEENGEYYAQILVVDQELPPLW